MTAAGPSVLHRRSVPRLELAITVYFMAVADLMDERLPLRFELTGGQPRPGGWIPC